MSGRSERTLNQIVNGGTACVRFTGRTEKDRRAADIFASVWGSPDPDDPENQSKQIRPQQILIEALLALGDKLQSGGDEAGHSEDDILLLHRYVTAQFEELKGLLVGFEQKIGSLVDTGILTREQGQQVSEALKGEQFTDEFNQNMIGRLKPGRVPGKK